jgi:hypothetical protein
MVDMINTDKLPAIRCSDVDGESNDPLIVTKL